MSSPMVITNEQIEAAKTWVYAYYKSFDSFDINNWLNKFHKPDIVLNLCNMPSMYGYKEIQAHFDQQNPQLSSMKHDIKQISVCFDRIYVQNQGVFIIKTDPEQKEIIVKAMAIYWKKLNEDKVSLIDVYFDPTPIMETIKMFS